MDSDSNDLEMYLAMLKGEPRIPNMNALINKMGPLKNVDKNVVEQVNHQLDLFCNKITDWFSEHLVIDEVFNAANEKIQYIGSDVKNEQLQIEKEKLEAEVNNLRKQLNQIKTEERKALRIYNIIKNLYSKAFQFELDILSFDEDHCTCKLDFIINGNNLGRSLFLKFDGQLKDVIDFDAKLLCVDFEEKELREWYQKTKNLPGLICKLRNKLLNVSNAT